MKAITCKVLRGNRLESVHHVSIAVVREGRVVLARGSIREPVFIRSCAKPFQAMTVLESGAADAFGFTPDEIAVICGSHSGEPVHVRAVRSILKKARVGVNGLRCGVHPPFTDLGRRAAAKHRRRRPPRCSEPMRGRRSR